MEPIPFKLLKIPEPRLKFKDSHSNYQRDITKFKPYSFQNKIKSKIGIVYPQELKEDIKNFVNNLKNEKKDWGWGGINLTFNCNFEFFEYEEKQINKKETIREYIDDKNEDILIIFCENLRDKDFWELKAQALSKKKRLQLTKIGVFCERFLNSQNSQMKYLYFLNYAVQLYSKAGGIPWILDSGTGDFRFVNENSLILGFSFGIDSDGVYYGIAQIVDYYGLTLKFEIFDAGYHKVEGFYIPKDEMEKLLNKAKKSYNSKYGSKPENIYIYKTSKFLEEEIEGIKSIDAKYYLIHTKMSGLSIRGYNTDEENYVIDRGTVLMYPEKKWCVLWTTGNLKNSKHTLGTPKSIELEILTNSELEPESLLKHISFQALALTKIDWEHVNWNVRKPAIFKYSNRAIKLSRYLIHDRNEGIGRLDVRDLM